MKIIVTGFEPFDGDRSNPSADLLNWLDKQSTHFELSTVLLPVSFTHAFNILNKEIQIKNPNYIIQTGYAKNRTEITIENIALNWVDAQIPDNEGLRPINQKILEEGPASIPTLIPINKMLEASHKLGIPAKLSHSAGEYVCNYLYYQTLKATPVPTVFIHIPRESENCNNHMFFQGIMAMINTL